MPNWVKHEMTISATTKKALQKFKDTHFKIGEDGGIEFDFNTIVEMPEHIFRGSLGQKERELFGDDNWYDWSVRNWGTKWNACASYIEDIKKQDGVYQTVVHFDTAWNAPHPIFERLAKLYKKLDFEIVYADEGIEENCGALTITDGEIIDNGYSEDIFEYIWGKVEDET